MSAFPNPSSQMPAETGAFILDVNIENIDDVEEMFLLAVDGVQCNTDETQRRFSIALDLYNMNKVDMLSMADTVRTAFETHKELVCKHVHHIHVITTPQTIGYQDMLLGMVRDEGLLCSISVETIKS
jgi:hypothetical protein